MSEPLIWALLGAHAGDNNQVLALAEALGLPFEIKPLRFNGWRRLGPGLLGSSLLSLERDLRPGILSSPPDLTISAGHRSVPLVQHLRLRSNGRTRSVHVGYPRISPDRFDLVVATQEYPVPDGPTVLRIPLALTRRPVDATSLADLPSPRRLLILGGPTLFWELRTGAVLAALARLIDEAKGVGSVIAVASPRTPAHLFDEVRTRLANAPFPALAVAANGSPAYASLLASADELFVTADSVAMVSDAVATGKPVGLIPIRANLLGRTYMATLKPNVRMRPRDLRFFWKAVLDLHLVGTVASPRAASPPDVNNLVAARVRDLLRQA